MRQMTKYLLLAGAVPAVAFSAVLALAHDSGGMMDRGGVMGRADPNGMMARDGRGGMMGSGMEGCMQMMQGMNGENQRPNEQWPPR